MGGWFAGQNEVAAHLSHGGGDRAAKRTDAASSGQRARLTGEQIVAQKNRPPMGQCRTMAFQPAFRGVAFAALFLRAILRHDERRW